MSNEMFVLRDKLNDISDFISDKSDVILVDYPLHYNVGDLLIFLGELKYLEQENIKLKYCLSTFNSDMQFLKKIVTKKTTILCHGGGNFGDLYSIHQNLREEVVKNFPNNRIIILPQTAHFEVLANQQKSQGVFNQHSDVIMFARDEKTLGVFQTFSKQSYLMPDMAHALYGTLSRELTQKGRQLYFLRKDLEKIESQILIESKIVGHDCLDWEDLISPSEYQYLNFINKIIGINNRYLNSRIVNKLIAKLWINQCNELTHKFSKLFSSYDLVITSRLHGHILACLVDVPSSVLDNSYGKNSSYYQLWTHKLPIAKLGMKEL